MKQLKNKYKPTIILFLFMAFSSEMSAQTGEVITPILSQPRPGVMLYLGAGSNSPSTKVKNDAYATNTVGFDANVFVSVIKKKNFSFGFNAGGEYFSGNKDNFPATPNPFHVVGETSGTVAMTSSGSPKTSGFKIGAAPQVNFFVGKKVIISPMIELGYMSMTSKGFSAVQTTTIDGTDNKFVLFSIKDTETSGLVVVPKVRLNYMFTKKIGMWVEGNYTAGPTVTNSISTFTPQDTPDENGQYNIDQMMNGTTKTEVRETKFGSFGVHVGVVFSILDVPDADDYPDLIKKDKFNGGSVQSKPESEKYTGPTLIAPIDGTIFKIDDFKKPVTLRWTPVIPCPNPDAGLVYIIRIYEVNKGQQPGQAVKSNTPVFEKQIKDTQAVWQVPSEYASSKKNITFVWNVHATNKEGKGYGMNNGVSENFNFKITDKITNNREK